MTPDSVTIFTEKVVEDAWRNKRADRFATFEEQAWQTYLSDAFTHFIGKKKGCIAIEFETSQEQLEGGKTFNISAKFHEL